MKGKKPTATKKVLILSPTQHHCLYFCGAIVGQILSHLAQGMDRKWSWQKAQEKPNLLEQWKKIFTGLSLITETT